MRTAQGRPPGQRINHPPDPQGLEDPRTQEEHGHELATVSTCTGSDHSRGRLLPRGLRVTLKPLFSFFVLEAGSRCEHILGVTATPDGQWTTQQLHNLLTDLGDRAPGLQYLVCDRTGQYTDAFDAILADSGIKP